MIELLQTFMNTVADVSDTSNTSGTTSSSSSNSEMNKNLTKINEKPVSSLNGNESILSSWSSILSRSSSSSSLMSLWPPSISWNSSNSSQSSNSNSEEETEDEKDEFDTLPQYTLAEVAEHCDPNDCWLIVEDRCYDVTKFLDDHPGGQYIVMEHAGRDATMVLKGSCHSEDAYRMLDKYLVGVLVESQRMYWTKKRRSNTTSTSSSSTSSSSTNTIMYGSSPKPSKGL